MTACCANFIFFDEIDALVPKTGNYSDATHKSGSKVLLMRLPGNGVVKMPDISSIIWITMRPLRKDHEFSPQPNHISGMIMRSMI